MAGAIVAVSANGVIGAGGELPWHYGDDLKRFKRVTMGATIIMGRKTWDSIGRKPLPGRRNMVISRSDVEDAECYTSIDAALSVAEEPVWIIGGAQIYRLSLPYLDKLDITYVPDVVEAEDAVLFPEIDLREWRTIEEHSNEDDPNLRHVLMQRRSPATT